MFGSGGRYRTETLEKGDVGYIPQGYGHSLENVGDKPSRILIGFNNGIYETIDLSQWIAGNPADVLATNFGKPEALFASSRKTMCSSLLKDGLERPGRSAQGMNPARVKTRPTMPRRSRKRRVERAHDMDLTRREWLAVAASVGAGLLPVGCTGRPDKQAIGGAEDVLAQFPGKVAMRVVNDRPPCLETPWRYFQHDFTPNEAFFVRSHLQTVPAAIDVDAWRLRIEGAVDRPLELSMRDLERMGGDEVVAVNQCSGNSRGFFGPRVPGAQWRHGAMGNARWAGVGLARMLREAGVRRDAVQVAFDGLDEGPLASVPDFVKVRHDSSTPPRHGGLLDERPCCSLTGFPPGAGQDGWYSTYWPRPCTGIIPACMCSKGTGWPRHTRSRPTRTASRIPTRS